MYSMKMLLVPNSGMGVLVGVPVGAGVGVSTIVGVSLDAGVAVSAETITAGAGAVGAGWRLSSSTRTAMMATNKRAAPPSQRPVLGFLVEGGWYDTNMLPFD